MDTGFADRLHDVGERHVLVVQRFEIRLASYAEQFHGSGLTARIRSQQNDIEEASDQRVQRLSVRPATNEPSGMSVPAPAVSNGGECGLNTMNRLVPSRTANFRAALWSSASISTGTISAVRGSASSAGAGSSAGTVFRPASPASSRADCDDGCRVLGVANSSCDHTM